MKIEDIEYPFGKWRVSVKIEEYLPLPSRNSKAKNPKHAEVNDDERELLWMNERDD